MSRHRLSARDSHELSLRPGGIKLNSSHFECEPGIIIGKDDVECKWRRVIIVLEPRTGTLDIKPGPFYEETSSQRVLGSPILTFVALFTYNR